MSIEPETHTGPIRVLLAKPTHDCHDRGVRLVARRLREAGFEVIFSNFLVVSEVIDAAIEEDVEVVGISSSAGGHMPVFEDLLQGLRDHGLDDVVVIGGGVIPPEDEVELRKQGVAEIFGPGSTAEDAIETIRSRAGVRT
ncbi:MAG: cobalamin B12-binding domain-containing protein [Acidimicrobiia bacterium]